MTQPLEQTELHCPACGYNLFGIESEKCPECGLEIDRTALGASQLPWTHRRQIGRIRAFQKTVVLAAFRPGRFAQEMNRPVSYADARLFRYICIILAWIPVTAATCYQLSTANRPFWMEIQLSMPELVMSCITASIALWIYLLAVTGFPGFFFHPRQLSIRRQNRAIALSYYAASAPLIGITLLGCILTFGYCVETILYSIGGDQLLDHWKALFIFLVVVFGAVLLTSIVFSVLAPIRLLGRIMHCGAVKQILFGGIIALAWATLFVVIVVGIMVATGYFAIIVTGLRLL